jgi:DNA-binding NtrC family response regulator
MMTQTPEAHDVQPYADEVFAGEGAAVTRLRLQVTRISPHFRTALVTGERGVGKESVAREMHRLSGLKSGSFRALEIARFADSTEPVELNGLLFLHGLERLEPALQDRLANRLKLIQRETRIIFASECDLRGMLATGRLRQNLSSRVGALEIRVTTLRDRMEDFDLLAKAMLQRSHANGWLGDEALSTLARHTWPGNLAELWTVMEHVSALRGEIAPVDLPELRAAETSDPGGVRLEKVMQRHVFEVLQRCSGNKLRTAELLGISRSTLYRMLEAADYASPAHERSPATSPGISNE